MAIAISNKNEMLTRAIYSQGGGEGGRIWDWKKEGRGAEADNIVHGLDKILVTSGWGQKI